MNRLISIGLSVAVAPAILVPISHWTGWPYADIDLSRAALVGLVLGGPLIVAGLLGASIKPTWKAINQIEQTHSEAIQKTRSRLAKVARNREVWRWALPIVIALVVFVNYLKVSATPPDGQSWLNAINGLWMLLAIILLRIVVGLFTWNSIGQFTLKIVVIAVLLYPLFILSMCSHMFSDPWVWNG